MQILVERSRRTQSFNFRQVFFVTIVMLCVCVCVFMIYYYDIVLYSIVQMTNVLILDIIHYTLHYIKRIVLYYIYTTVLPMYFLDQLWYDIEYYDMI